MSEHQTSLPAALMRSGATAAAADGEAAADSEGAALVEATADGDAAADADGAALGDAAMLAGAEVAAEPPEQAPANRATALARASARVEVKRIYCLLGPADGGQADVFGTPQRTPEAALDPGRCGCGKVPRRAIRSLRHRFVRISQSGPARPAAMLVDREVARACFATGATGFVGSNIARRAGWASCALA
ncbi:MAG: hypothetical protein ACYDAN_01310 [Candidatus Limnocylindrales bacterium]